MSRRDISRELDVNEALVRYWEDQGIVPRYGSVDEGVYRASVRVVNAAREGGATMVEVRRAFGVTQGGAMSSGELKLSESEKGLTYSEILHARADALIESGRFRTFTEAAVHVLKRDPALAAAHFGESLVFAPEFVRRNRLLSERAARGEGANAQARTSGPVPARGGLRMDAPSWAGAEASVPGDGGAVAAFLAEIDKVRGREGARVSFGEAAVLVATSHPALKVAYDRELVGHVASLERGARPDAEDA